MRTIVSLKQNKTAICSRHVFAICLILLCFLTPLNAQRTTSVDANGTKITTGNIVTEAATAPTTPTPIQGDIWFDTTSDVVKTWDGGIWKTVTTDGVANEPWFGTDNNAAATSNTENIYVMGKVGIGTKSPKERLHVKGNLEVAGNIIHAGHDFKIWSASRGGEGTSLGRAIVHDGNGTKAGSYMHLNYDRDFGRGIVISGRVGIGTLFPTAPLSVSGHANKSGGGDWGTFSDKRVKQNITHYTTGLKAVLQIRPVTYQYKENSGYDDTETQFVGVIAQEIEKVLPTTVSLYDDSEGPSGLSDKRVFDSSELLYTLINAVKEQQQQIENIKNQNEELKQENELLTARFSKIEAALNL